MPVSIQVRGDAQREYFSKGHTLPVAARLDALKRLKRALIQMEGEINAALKADLGKSASESYLCETGMVLSEINHMLRHVRAYARPRRGRFACRGRMARCW